MSVQSKLAPTISVPFRLSQHFTLSEATVTNTGIDNSPSPEDLVVLALTARKMEQVRSILNDSPITVNSWYRNDAVNKKVGGVPLSQHRLGEAVDFTCVKFGSINQVVQALLDEAKALEFDQLILEPSWVHISFLTNPKDPRKVPRLQYIDLSGGK